MDEYKEKTLESYNKHTLYHTQRFSGLFDIGKRTEFDTFINLLPGKSILDVGCGGGENARYFLDQGLEVLGIDISESMVEMCRENGVSAKVMDMEEITFDPLTFDGIWAVTSLLHIPKSHLSQVIKSLHAILKPDGVVYVCVKEGDGEVMVRDVIDSTERFFAYWQRDELQSVFEALFEVVSFKREVVGSRTFLMFFFRKK